MEQMESSKDLFGIQEDFQPLRGEAHEKELMNFAAEDYDAGASLHVGGQPTSHVEGVHLKLRREAQSSFKTWIECN